MSTIISEGHKTIKPLFNFKRTINPVVIDSEFLGFSIPKGWCKDVPDFILTNSNSISGLYDKNNSKLIKIPSDVSEFNPQDKTFNIQKTRELLESFGVIRETTYKPISPRFTIKIISDYGFFSRPGKRKVDVGIILNQDEVKGIPKSLISNDEEKGLIVKIPYNFFDLLETYIEDPENLISGFITKYKLFKSSNNSFS